jgi:hypothetical protein
MKDQKTKKGIACKLKYCIKAYCETHPLIRDKDIIILLLDITLAVPVSFEIDVTIAKAESL